jgi:hypothetical protein
MLIAAAAAALTHVLLMTFSSLVRSLERLCHSRKVGATRAHYAFRYGVDLRT